MVVGTPSNVRLSRIIVPVIFDRDVSAQRRTDRADVLIPGSKAGTPTFSPNIDVVIRLHGEGDEEHYDQHEAGCKSAKSAECVHKIPSLC